MSRTQSERQLSKLPEILLQQQQQFGVNLTNVLNTMATKENANRKRIQAIHDKADVVEDGFYEKLSGIDFTNEAIQTGFEEWGTGVGAELNRLHIAAYTPGATRADRKAYTTYKLNASNNVKKIGTWVTAFNGNVEASQTDKDVTAGSPDELGGRVGNFVRGVNGNDNLNTQHVDALNFGGNLATGITVKPGKNGTPIITYLDHEKKEHQIDPIHDADRWAANGNTLLSNSVIGEDHDMMSGEFGLTNIIWNNQGKNDFQRKKKTVKDYNPITKEWSTSVVEGPQSEEFLRKNLNNPDNNLNRIMRNQAHNSNFNTQWDSLYANGLLYEKDMYGEAVLDSDGKPKLLPGADVSWDAMKSLSKDTKAFEKWKTDAKKEYITQYNEGKDAAHQIADITDEDFMKGSGYEDANQDQSFDVEDLKETMYESAVQGQINLVANQNKNQGEIQLQQSTIDSKPTTIKGGLTTATINDALAFGSQYRSVYDDIHGGGTGKVGNFNEVIKDLNLYKKKPNTEYISGAQMKADTRAGYGDYATEHNLQDDEIYTIIKTNNKLSMQPTGITKANMAEERMSTHILSLTGIPAQDQFLLNPREGYKGTLVSQDDSSNRLAGESDWYDAYKL